MDSHRTHQPLPPLDESILPMGLYRHYKGDRYEVIGLVGHSETLETLVLYRASQGGPGLWVRPLAMFREHVEVDGRKTPRFEYIPS